MNQGQEGSQDHLVLLVKKVFPDSKDQLVYLVSLDHLARLVREETKVFLGKGAVTVQLERREKEERLDLLEKMERRENLDRVVLLEHLEKQV